MPRPHEYPDLPGIQFVVNDPVKGASGAQAHALSTGGPDDVFLYMRRRGSSSSYTPDAWGHVSLETLLERVMQGNYNAHEMVPENRRRKFYMEYDILEPDVTLPDDHHQARFRELQAKAVADAESVCGPGIAVLSGSWGHYQGQIKYSVHVVRPDRYLLNHQATLPMRVIVASLGADTNVYGKNQKFKLPNQSKPGDRRIQYIISGRPEQHVLTAAFDEGATELKLEVPDSAVQHVVRTRTSELVRSKGARKTVPLQAWPDPVDFPADWAMSSPPLETLNLIRHKPDPPHRIPRNVRYGVIMGWARHRGIAFEDFMDWAFKGKEDTAERRTRYAADWNAWASKRPVPDKSVLLILKTLYPDVCFDNQNVRLHNQRHDIKTTRVAKGDRHQLTLEETLSGRQQLFLGERDFGDERAVCFHVGMGRGKTTQIRNVMRRKQRALCLTTRVTLSDDIYGNCKREGGTELKHYKKDFPTAASKQHMGEANQLICQLESVHYLAGTKPYDVVFVDEMELLLIQATSSDTIKDMRLTWETLKCLLRTAKYVRCYDGFMGRKTTEFLEGLGIEVAVVRMPDHNRPNGRVFHVRSIPKDCSPTGFMQRWATEIGLEVAAGKNVMVYHHFINSTCWLTQKEVMKIICDVGGIDMERDTLMINRRSPKTDKEADEVLSNINAHFQKRVVMTNSRITAGVDFTVRWFHKLYMASPAFQNPRECIQWLSRARNLVDNEVHVVRLPGKKPAPVPDLIGDCPVYKHLVAAINTELQNNAREVLEAYAVEAGYKLDKPASKFSDDVVAAAENIEILPDLGLTFDNIPIIESGQAAVIQRRMAGLRSTFDEKVQLEKHLFTKRFKPGTDADFMRTLWDNGFVRATEAMHRYKNGSNLRTELPELCGRIDELMERVLVCPSVEDEVDEVFHTPLSPATFAATDRRYPTLDRKSASTKRIVNTVMQEVACMEIWKYDHKAKRFIVNNHLEHAALLHLVVAGGAGEAHVSVPGGAR